MRYEGTVYRPPSEAHSLIVQVTIGCAHNSCTFCTMYKDKKFRIRTLEEIKADFDEGARLYGPYIQKVFLADGDALAIPTDMMLEILAYIKVVLPNAKQITSYGTTQDILRKSEDELKQLADAGLDMIYMGVESGHNEILKQVCKGVTAEQMIEAGKKARRCGFKLSITLISGLGGKQYLKEHAIASAKVITEVKPEYLGFLTLMVKKDAAIYPRIVSGELELLDPIEVLEEMKIFLEAVDSEGTVFRANHASNYVLIKGDLNKDIPDMISGIDRVMQQGLYRPERYRRL